MNYQPITLGALIAALEVRKPEEPTYFDFCDTIPDGVMSYRGYYDHLSIQWKLDGVCVVAALLGELRLAVGGVFEGYKGGNFRMSNETPIWVANYGRSGSTAIVGVSGRYSTVIQTGFCESWNGGVARTVAVLRDGLGFGNVR